MKSRIYSFFHVITPTDTLIQAQGVWRVEWNATGTMLASSGEEGVVRLWKSTFRGEWREVKAVPSEHMEQPGE